MFFKVSALVLCHIEAFTQSAILVCRKGQHPGQPKSRLPAEMESWSARVASCENAHGHRIPAWGAGVMPRAEHRIHAQGKGFVPGAQDSSPGDRLIAQGIRFVARVQEACLGHRIRTQGIGF